MLKSQKWAKQVLKENKEYFTKAQSALFGSSFHKTLQKLANVRKESKQLTDQLAMPSTVIFNLILPIEFLTDPFVGGSHDNIGNLGIHTLPRQEVSRKRAQANTVSVLKTVLKKPRLMAPVTQKLPEISELRGVPKLPELRGPNIYLQ